MVISSRDNSTIKQAKKLLLDVSERRKTGNIFLEGARLCEDALETGLPIKTAFLTKEAMEKYPSQTKRIQEIAETCYEITESISSYLTDTKNPQGIFCICEKKKFDLDVHHLSKENCYLVLEDVRDPGNLGTVIRTAEAFGATALIVSSGCCDTDNPKVLRGSMGGALRLPILEVDNLPLMISKWNEQGFQTYACVADATAEKITECSLKKGSICLIGNEANGLTKETIDACLHSMTIPMKGRAESLNAAVAASVVLWELLK